MRMIKKNSNLTGWDNPPARPVATSDLNVFEKNSTVVEQVIFHWLWYAVFMIRI
jgi:hypothetical protein